MSATKTAMTISSVAIAMLFGGGVYLYMNLGSIAKNYTEKAASQALGVNVNIGTMDIQIENRKAVVKNLKISNPPGFSKPHALTVSEISVTLGDLSQELVKIKDISVDETNVYLEVKESGTNLNVLKKNAEANAAKSSGGSSAEQIKVIIDRVALTEAQLNPSVTLFQEQDLKSVTVPDIVLTGVGRKENGILAREAIAQVMQHVLKKVQTAASNAGFYQGLSPDMLEDIGTSQIEGIKDKIGGDVDDVKDKIKGLFGDN